MASSGVEVSGTKLSVRHSFSTVYVSTINERLTKEQRAVISKTPFGWFLELDGKVIFNTKILRELTKTWVDSSNAFIIGDKVFNMNEEAFCSALGFSLDGKTINLKDPKVGSSECVTYLGEGNKDLNFIYKFLLKKHKKTIPCEHFCSLYILLGICEILLPCRSGRVPRVLFEIVDDLSRLSEYSWGSLVYRYLLENMSKAADSVKKGKATSNVYVDGCVYMLQVWFCEHFMPPKGPIEKVPRILYWMNTTVGDNIVKRVFEMGVVNVRDDFGGMKKDEKDVRENQPPPNSYEEKQRKKLLKKKRRKSLMRTAEDQKSLIEGLKREVYVLEAELEAEKARRTPKRSTADDGVSSVGRPELFSDDAFVSPIGVATEEAGAMCNAEGCTQAANAPVGMSDNQTELKTYVRIGSRRRFKSQALRTPFTGNVLLRKKNE